MINATCISSWRYLPLKTAVAELRIAKLDEMRDRCLITNSPAVFRGLALMRHIMAISYYCLMTAQERLSAV
jgi:hypothetical protein